MLRLFGSGGTRLVITDAGVIVTLLTLRAATQGVTVRIATSRPQVWRHLLADAEDAVVAGLDAGPAPGGELWSPVLIVDDRPAEHAPGRSAGNWQCRLDVRAPLRAAVVGRYAGDALLTGRLDAEAAHAVAGCYGLSGADAAVLSGLARGTAALVTPGRLRVAMVGPDRAELPRLAALPPPRPPRPTLPPPTRIRPCAEP